MSRVNMARELQRINLSKSLAMHREKGWNDRFILAKIPKYDAYLDRYCNSPL